MCRAQVNKKFETFFGGTKFGGTKKEVAWRKFIDFLFITFEC